MAKSVYLQCHWSVILYGLQRASLMPRVEKRLHAMRKLNSFDSFVNQKQVAQPLPVVVFVAMKTTVFSRVFRFVVMGRRP